MTNKGWKEPPNKINRKGKLVAGRHSEVQFHKGSHTLVEPIEPETWEETAKRELEKELGVKTEIGSYEYYENLGAIALVTVKGEAKNGESEWIVFPDLETAKKAAVHRVGEDLENNPEYFEESWLLSQIDNEKAERFFREMYDEWNRSYVNDIKREDSDEYINRLAAEMVSNGIITEEEGRDKDFNLDTKIDEFVENMTNEQISEGNGGFEHYSLNFGEDEAKKILKDNNLIDIDSAAQNAVDIDGVAHFIDMYDNNAVELPSGAVAYGTN